MLCLRLPALLLPILAGWAFAQPLLSPASRAGEEGPYRFGEHALCTDIYLPIHVEANNVLFNGDLIDKLHPTEEQLFTLFSLSVKSSDNFTREYVRGDYPVDAHYTIYGQLCEPRAEERHSDDGALQVLVHGTPFDHGYWSAASKAHGIPSYVDEAAKHGQSTFAYDRLGVGRSSIPIDAFEDIQLNSDIVVLERIVEAARTTTAIGGRRWRRVMAQGHAYGALILLGATQRPDSEARFDGVVLQGITNNARGLGYFVASATFHIAQQTLPLRQSHPPSYICFGSSVATFFSWSPLRAYPTVPSQYRFENQHPLAPGVPLTRSAPMTRTSTYSKPVMLVVGDRCVRLMLSSRRRC